MTQTCIKEGCVQDRHGKNVSVGDEVDVGEPKANDLHNHGFRGTVDAVNPEEGYVTVIDQDAVAWDVDADNVELVG